MSIELRFELLVRPPIKSEITRFDLSHKPNQWPNISPKSPLKVAENIKDIAEEDESTGAAKLLLILMYASIFLGIKGKNMEFWNDVYGSAHSLSFSLSNAPKNFLCSISNLMDLDRKLSKIGNTLLANVDDPAFQIVEGRTYFMVNKSGVFMWLPNMEGIRSSAMAIQELPSYDFYMLGDLVTPTSRES